jgi:cysteinyl-tRNA synthetase
MEATRQGFLEAMDDDFNSAGALGYLFELVRVINQARDAGLSADQLEPAQELLVELAGVFGLRLRREKVTVTPADVFIYLLVQVRSELRQQKLWQLGDQIRDRLADLGVQVEDSKDGSTWRWK